MVVTGDTLNGRGGVADQHRIQPTASKRSGDHDQQGLGVHAGSYFAGSAVAMPRYLIRPYFRIAAIMRSRGMA